MTMSSWSSAEVIRPGVMSMIRALPWVPVVMMPACEPVSERACIPWSWMAMASSAALIRSPAVSSMSSSRGGGSGETCSARSISSSVVSPIAEMTTTTSWPCCLGGDDPLGHPLDAVGIGDRRPAVLLDYPAHAVSRRTLSTLSSATHCSCGARTRAVMSSQTDIR